MSKVFYKYTIHNKAFKTHTKLKTLKKTQQNNKCCNYYVTKLCAEACIIHQPTELHEESICVNTSSFIESTRTKLILLAKFSEKTGTFSRSVSVFVKLTSSASDQMILKGLLNDVII